MTARPQDVQATFAATLVDEWVRSGVTDAVVCPGSRSTPLALALAGHAGLTLHVHVDERSGSFLALGMGLARGRPAVVLTTSGTAAVEVHAAVVEAHQAGVPLLVCTADRPPELQDVGGPQVIDQTHLYGRAVRWFADPGVPEAGGAARWRPLAARAVAETMGDHPGPVQLNLPFREPLVGDPGPLPAPRGAGQPWVAAPVAVRAPAALPAGIAGRRGVIVAGAGSAGEATHRLAAALGWPVLAEPRSPAWRPAPTLVPHADALLRSPRAAEALRPEAVLRLGPPPASRLVNEWLAASGATEVVVAGRSWSDPAGTAATVVPDDPAAAVAAWSAALAAGTPVAPAPPDWLVRWQEAGAAAARSLATTVGGRTEPGVARDLVAALPDGAWLVVSSSMPVRDVERYAAPRTGVRIVANRGANGIDGVVSTAVGVAAGSRAPTGLLIGDLAFLHDANGLLGAARRGVDLVCVVVDNDGGGIFSFLPQAGQLPRDRFERLFGTPHGLDLVAVARAHGADARAVESDVGAEVREAAAKGGLHVLVVRTERAANVDVHRTVDDAVAEAVDAALGPERGPAAVGAGRRGAVAGAGLLSGSMDPFTPALDWADAIRRKEVSPVEVADLYLERIDRLDDSLGAFVHRADDDVRAAAARAAQRITEAPAGDLPPFLGVPLPIKDLNPVVGWPCTYGSEAVPRTPAPASDVVVERFVAAGFVPLGVTASPELGTISYTESRAHGVTRNPWDTDRTPGGSSGGAAAATASGMAPIAHASDGGGSIRIPAACCGLVGLKPSRNRVVAAANSLEGLATSGVVTRTVADTAAVLDVICGPDPLSWYNAPPPARPFAEQAREAPGRLRIRYATAAPLGLAVDPACRAAVEATAAALAEAGHDVAEGELELPDADEMVAAFTTVWNTGSARVPGLDPARLEPLNQALRRAGEAVSSVAYVEAVMAAQEMSRRVVARIREQADVLLMPTMACLPPAVGSVWEGADDNPLVALLNCYPMGVFTSLWNVTGLPALSLPVHVSDGGLPVGVQLVAGPWQEGRLLQLGTHLEQALPWADRRPPVS